jgi:hypothetical protein
MKYLIYAAALLAAAQASPLSERQLLDLDQIEDAPKPTTASVPIGVASDVAHLDLAAASKIAEIPLPVQTDAVKRHVGKTDLVARTACAPQPTGAGPVPTPDTASAFRAWGDFASEATRAAVPSGYAQVYQNLQGSSQALGYMGFSLMNTYDTQACADKCSSVLGCIGVNIYYERDPSVEPGSGCDDPPSTTAIKCVLWGGVLTQGGATNTGQWRDQFEVAIAGSNAYMNTTIQEIAGYTSTYLGPRTINAPLDCNNKDTYMGFKQFSTTGYRPDLCALACTKQNEYNTAHPPSDGSDPKICHFFTSYELMINNSIPQGFFCALYSETWDASYAKNDVSIPAVRLTLNNANPNKPLGTMAWI